MKPYCAKADWARRLKALALAAALLATALSLCGCAAKPSGYQRNDGLDTSQPVRIVIAGTWTNLRGMDLVAARFHEEYPNCTVEYEYLQDFPNTLPKRIMSQDDRVDIFTTPNILPDSENRAYALDLLEHRDALPLADTFKGLVDNYKFTDGNNAEHLYAVPLGGEIRGMYVNTTILNSLGIAVPKNRSELLAACEKLQEAGYVPMQDNPGTFGQRLLFPYIARLAAGARESIAACDENAAEVFRDPLEFLYRLTASYYYNYKFVEKEYGRFIDLSGEGIARSFLNVAGEEDAYRKLDDIGGVPFMPASGALMPAIDKAKENYHSLIEYEFILAPVSDEGGFAYMSPYSGLAINKDSFHLDWAIEFMNFFFTAENNKVFAEAANITPNTTDALEIIGRKYGIPVNEIGQPESVTFGNYNFYNLIIPSLVDISKGNNPKYMREDGSMYPLQHYFDGLKEAFAIQREAIKR